MLCINNLFRGKLNYLTEKYAEGLKLQLLASLNIHRANIYSSPGIVFRKRGKVNKLRNVLFKYFLYLLRVCYTLKNEE